MSFVSENPPFPSVETCFETCLGTVREPSPLLSFAAFMSGGYLAFKGVQRIIQAAHMALNPPEQHVDIEAQVRPLHSRVTPKILLLNGTYALLNAGMLLSLSYMTSHTGILNSLLYRCEDITRK